MKIQNIAEMNSLYAALQFRDLSVAEGNQLSKLERRYLAEYCGECDAPHKHCKCNSY